MKYHGRMIWPWSRREQCPTANQRDPCQRSNQLQGQFPIRIGTHIRPISEIFMRKLIQICNIYKGNCQKCFPFYSKINIPKMQCIQNKCSHFAGKLLQGKGRFWSKMDNVCKEKDIFEAIIVSWSITCFLLNFLIAIFSVHHFPVRKWVIQKHSLQCGPSTTTPKSLCKLHLLSILPRVFFYPGSTSGNA